MPDRLEPHWWAIIATAVAGFIGWRLKSAQDAVRLENAMRDLERVENRVKALESGSVATASALASISTSIEGIGRTLTRLEAKLDGKADK